MRKKKYTHKTKKTKIDARVKAYKRKYLRSSRNTQENIYIYEKLQHKIIQYKKCGNTQICIVMYG